MNPDPAEAYASIAAIVRQLFAGDSAAAGGVARGGDAGGG